jgi:hypothetical protein
VAGERPYRSADGDPFITNDGQKMFFTSVRSTVGGEKDKYHIWMMTKNHDEWSEPQNIEVLNSSGNDAFPTVATNGNLYFWSDRPVDKNGGSLYRSRFRDGEYQPPERLGPPINSEEWSSVQPFVAASEDYLIYVMYGRPDEKIAVGSPVYIRGDLYVSFRKTDGSWDEPVHLPSPINTAAAEASPSVSPDGKWLFFVSDRCFVPEEHDHRFTYEELASELTLISFKMCSSQGLESECVHQPFRRTVWAKVPDMNSSLFAN